MSYTKWNIKITEDNYQEIGKYYDSKLDTDIYNDIFWVGYYISSHNTDGIYICNSNYDTNRSFVDKLDGGTIDIKAFRIITKNENYEIY